MSGGPEQSWLTPTLLFFHLLSTEVELSHRRRQRDVYLRKKNVEQYQSRLDLNGGRQRLFLKQPQKCKQDMAHSRVKLMEEAGALRAT
ncbi:hypothetical protein CapIbe_006792 [Capra ibex]